MRITGNQYAKALYEMTVGKSQEEISGVIFRFVKILAKNGQMRLKNEILQKFETVFNLKNNVIAAEVKSREKLSEELLEKLKVFIGEKYAGKVVVIKNRIDERIQGGIIVKVGDEVMDASVKGQLQKMRNSLVG